MTQTWLRIFDVRFLFACSISMGCLCGSFLDAAFPASVKSSGMGGADEAYPLDSLALFDNPASAAEIDTRLDLSGIWQGRHKQVTISNRPLPSPFLQQGTLHANNETQFWGGAGGNFWVNCNLALGLAWTHYDDIHTRYGVILQDFAPVGVGGEPIGPNARLEYNVECISGAIAYRWNECHSFGIAINGYLSRFLVAGVGGLGSEAAPTGSLGSLAALDITTDPNDLTDNGHENNRGVGVTIGWTGHFWPCLTTAISYSPKVHMGRLNRYKGFIAGHRIDIPETVRFGLAWGVSDCLTFAADGEYRRYSKVHAWGNAFPGDSTTGIGPLFGDSNGPGFGWRDQWIAKMGLEWRPYECWQFRFGYRYESLPFDRKGSAAALNILTLRTVDNFLSAGATWQTNCWGELSAFGEYGFSHTSRSQFPEISDDAVVIFEPGDLAFKSHSYRVGIAYGWSF